MKTLCLFNPNAHCGQCLDPRPFFRNNTYWGDISFHSLTKEDKLTPSWIKYSDGFSKILIVGGDGTIHHSIQHIIGKNIEVNILPSGTANDFASFVGIPARHADALHVLQHGKTIGYDTVSANGRHILTGGGFGIGYNIADSANRIKLSKIGELLYRATQGALYSVLLCWHSIFKCPIPLHASLIIDNDRKDIKHLAIIFTNQPNLGKQIVLAPQTIPNDGKFHVVVFSNPHGLSLLKSLVKLKLGILYNKDQWLIRNEVEEITITYKDAVPAFGDGEDLPPNNLWKIRCHKSSLQLRVPAGFNA